MRMRSWMLRLLRVVFVALAAWIGFHVLDPKGLGWTVPVGMGVIAVIWIAYRYALVSRRRAADAQADRWAEALMSPPDRPAAVREIRAAIASADGKKRAVERARLTLVLAELLEADGEPEAARKALDEIAIDALPERTAALVRHARAVASISAGDADAAAAILDDQPGPCGDRSIDLRIRLLRGVVAVERGDGEDALTIAEQARQDAGADADLKMEARVLKAVALDALGDREDAIKVMRALGDDMLEVLLVLGFPRVKKLAEAALSQD